MASSVVVEWAPFELRAGIDESRLIRASDALQAEFLSKRPGFLRRELLKGRDGKWVDLVYWQDQDAADGAAKSAATSQVCYEYFQLMGADHANPGAGVLHFDQVRVFTK